MGVKPLQKDLLWKFGALIVGAREGLFRFSHGGKGPQPPVRVALQGRAVEMLAYIAQRSFESDGATLAEIHAAVWTETRVKLGTLRGNMSDIADALGGPIKAGDVLVSNAEPGEKRRYWIRPRVAAATARELTEAPFCNHPVRGTRMMNAENA